jgi:hypothetical protein
MTEMLGCLVPGVGCLLGDSVLFMHLLLFFNVGVALLTQECKMSALFMWLREKVSGLVASEEVKWELPL